MSTDSTLVLATETLATALNQPTWIDVATLVLIFITTVLWGFYVIYTRKTFLEIKQQTELQSQGYLVMEPSIKRHGEVRAASLEADGIAAKAQELHSKWEEVLQQFIPKAVHEDQYAVLCLRNRGGSDVIWVKISITARIDPGAFLSGKLITEITEPWEVEQNITIRPGDDTEIPLVQVNAFPNVNLSWKVEYKDIRESHLVAKAGKTELTHSSLLKKCIYAKMTVVFPCGLVL